MVIKVLVNGAFGRMGQLAVNAIKNHPTLELVGQTGREYDLKKSIIDSGAKVVVDFTLPDSVYENTLAIIAAGAHPVIGTSGLNQTQIETLKAKCRDLQLGGIIAPNFSLGAVLMMKYAKEIAKYMPYVEIIELHHHKKIDSPSGTALRTAEMISEVQKIQSAAAGKETIPGARGAIHHGIPIHSIRLPGLLADQQVIFGGLSETLTLTHNSLDRQAFMPGVCLACEKVLELKNLVYGLEEVL